MVVFPSLIFQFEPPADLSDMDPGVEMSTEFPDVKEMLDKGKFPLKDEDGDNYIPFFIFKFAYPLGPVVFRMGEIEKIENGKFHLPWEEFGWNSHNRASYDNFFKLDFLLDYKLDNLKITANKIFDNSNYSFA